jgi:hypothetical protein
VGTAYFRVVAEDANGAVRILSNQVFTVTEKAVIPPSTEISTEKILENIKESSNISTDKKDSCVATAKAMLEAEFEPAFVAGMLGNVCHEGKVGQFEKHWGGTRQDYLLPLHAKYGYDKEYAFKYIYDVSFQTVYQMVDELDTNKWQIDGKTAKFGLGSVQWTADRTYALMEVYKEINNGKSTISKAQATEAEGVMIVRELLNKRYNVIHANWKKSNTNLNSQEAAYNAAHNLCTAYEVPADTENQAKERGNLAKLIYSDMMK